MLWKEQFLFLYLNVLSSVPVEFQYCSVFREFQYTWISSNKLPDFLKIRRFLIAHRCTPVATSSWIENDLPILVKTLLAFRYI